MVLICATGFAVLDYLYVGVDYSTPAFKKYQSKTRGDGGLNPGHLSFVSAWEKFAGKPIAEIRKEQNWDREPDHFNVGGPCIVGAINAAQLTATTGTTVKYYGALANDETGRRMMEIIKKTPVDTAHLKIHDKGSSPFSVCLSDPKYNNGAGERSFAVNIGLFESLPLSEIIDDSFFRGDILFYSATALAPTLHNNLTSLLRRGKEMGKLNVVGTVFDHISEAERPGQPWSMGEDSNESFKCMDLLMLDWDEAMGISGKNTISEAIQFFQTKGVRALTVTHGPEPLWAYSDGTVFKKMAPRTFPVCAAVTRDLRANPQKAGDSTGCGDNFAGGVVAAIADAMEKGVPRGQLDLVDAIAWGSASGGLTLFVVGGTYLEQEPGEKRTKVDYYRKEFLRQIQTSKL